MTKIKGKWIRQEDTELRILEKLLKNGPLKIPAIEDKNGKDRLSHTSVLIGISKLLSKKSILIKDEDNSIPKRSVKTYEITPAGMFHYLEWIFPNEKMPEHSDDMWESIKKSGQKFRRQNITPHYFPIVDKHWKTLEQIGEAPAWWFGTSVGRCEFTKAPYARNIVPDDLPTSYFFSFNVNLSGPDFDTDRTYELKISHVTLIFKNSNPTKSKNPNPIEDYSELQKTISETITFLFFYSMLYDRIQKMVMFKSLNVEDRLSEDTKIVNSIIDIIKYDNNLKIIFREYLSIIYSKVQTDKTVSYLLHATSKN